MTYNVGGPLNLAQLNCTSSFLYSTVVTGRDGVAQLTDTCPFGVWADRQTNTHMQLMTLPTHWLVFSN